MAKLQINAKPRGGPASCPLCSETLARGGQARECPGCQVRYHAACLDELGGCGTLGCARAKRIATAPPRRAAARAPRGSQNSPVVMVMIAVALVAGIVVATKSKHAQPPRAPVAPPAEPWKRPLRTSQVVRFVASVGFLVTIRRMEKQVGSSFESVGLGETSSTSRERALQAYENLLESSGWTPAEVRAELALQVKQSPTIEDQAEAQEIMAELFATVDSDPVFGRQGAPVGGDRSAAQERELRKAAELIATGKDQNDPEVRKHIEAAFGGAFDEPAGRQGMSGAPASGG